MKSSFHNIIFSLKHLINALCFQCVVIQTSCINTLCFHSNIFSKCISIFMKMCLELHSKNNVKQLTYLFTFHFYKCNCKQYFHNAQNKGLAENVPAYILRIRGNYPHPNLHMKKQSYKIFLFTHYYGIFGIKYL